MKKPKSSKSVFVYDFLKCKKYLQEKYPNLENITPHFWNNITYLLDLQNDTYVTIERLRWNDNYQEAFDLFDKEFGEDAIYSVCW